VEAIADAEDLESLEQCAVLVRGEQVLLHPLVRNELEDAGRIGVQPALGDARVVRVAVFVRQSLERLREEIETERAIVLPYGKVKRVPVLLAIDLGHAPGAEHGVEHVEAEHEVVQRRPVPVPDDVPVAAVEYRSNLVFLRQRSSSVSASVTQLAISR